MSLHNTIVIDILKIVTVDLHFLQFPVAYYNNNTEVRNKQK